MNKLFMLLFIVGCGNDESYCYYDNGSLMVKSGWASDPRVISKHATWREARDVANEMNCSWKN